MKVTKDLLKFCNDDRTIVIKPTSNPTEANANKNVRSAYERACNGLCVSDNRGVMCIGTNVPTWVSTARNADSGALSGGNAGAYSLKVNDMPVALTPEQGIFRSNGYVPTCVNGFIGSVISTVDSITFSISQGPYVSGKDVIYYCVVFHELDYVCKIIETNEYSTSYDVERAYVTNSSGNRVLRDKVTFHFNYTIDASGHAQVLARYTYNTQPTPNIYASGTPHYSNSIVADNNTLSFIPTDNDIIITSGFSKGNGSVYDGIQYTISGATVVDGGGFMSPSNKALVSNTLSRDLIPIDSNVLRHKGGYYV